MRPIIRILSAGSLKPAAVFSLVLAILFAQIGRAQDPLQFFKNYFVTGDYAVAGIGLYGQGVSGYATNTLTITGVPCTVGGPGPGTSLDAACANPSSIPAEPIAAFLIWQSIETSPSPSSANGWFDKQAITGSVTGNPNGLGCWSSGGTNPNGFLRVYVADVLRFLPFDSTNGVHIANGAHTVKLVDSGGVGNGQVTHTFGASLVVVYRITVPGALPALAPLRGVALYLGGFVSPKSSAGLTQTIGGFYDATGGAGSAKMTHIVANGQPGFGSTIYVNGTTVGTNAFTGTAGGEWDNVTFDISSVLGAEPAPRGSYQTQVTSSGNQTCYSWGAIVTSTLVNDADSDGLLDTWETKGLHLNPGDAAHNATFGGCADYPSDPCENLPAIGAVNGIKDIFLQLDWMHGTGDGTEGMDGHGAHDHTPPLQVLTDIYNAFNAHAIKVHFDVGSLYQGLPYIIPSNYAKGGADLDESTLLCHSTGTYTCAYDGSVYPYPALSKNGLNLVKDGNGIQGSPFQYGHFPYVRNWAFRYVLIAHAQAGPFDPTTGKPLGSAPTSVSGVADRPGGDILITLGLWRSDVPANDQVGSILQQEGTLMHELGHTLNLRHAGLTLDPTAWSAIRA